MLHYYSLVRLALHKHNKVESNVIKHLWSRNIRFCNSHVLFKNPVLHMNCNLHMNMHFFPPFKVDKQNQQVESSDWLSVHNTSHQRSNEGLDRDRFDGWLWLYWYHRTQGALLTKITCIKSAQHTGNDSCVIIRLHMHNCISNANY